MKNIIYFLFPIFIFYFPFLLFLFDLFFVFPFFFSFPLHFLFSLFSFLFLFSRGLLILSRHSIACLLPFLPNTERAAWKLAARSSIVATGDNDLGSVAIGDCGRWQRRPAIRVLPQRATAASGTRLVQRGTTPGAAAWG
jgi:hypothetical protein